MWNSDWVAVGQFISKDSVVSICNIFKRRGQILYVLFKGSYIFTMLSTINKVANKHF